MILATGTSIKNESGSKSFKFFVSPVYYINAAVMELAYMYASGAYGRKAVRVQVPPAAP